MSSFFLDEACEKQSVGALAIGSFDGVHRGHKSLLNKAIELSSRTGSKSATLSFSPNPKQFFSTADRPFLKIYDLDQNLEEILATGVDHVFVKKFDKDCSQMTDKEFLNFVFDRVEFTDLVVGFDFRFGKDRGGGPSNLENWCSENGVRLNIVSAQLEDEKKISSTRIKKLLLKGDVLTASKLLGRPHYYKGRVCSDQGLGKKIGFPTLNIPLDLNTAIAHGVYITELKSGNNTYLGLSNIGLRPTVFDSASKLVLETHILDAEAVAVSSGDLISVELRQFVRSEKKFANIDELRAQIAKDITAVQGLGPSEKS